MFKCHYEAPVSTGEHRQSHTFPDHLNEQAKGGPIAKGAAAVMLLVGMAMSGGITLLTLDSQKRFHFNDMEVVHFSTTFLHNVLSFHAGWILEFCSLWVQFSGSASDTSTACQLPSCQSKSDNGCLCALYNHILGLLCYCILRLANVCHCWCQLHL